MNNITLIGMPGSGKSTVGVLLAKTLGYGFLDVDLLIQQREGALLQEILDSRGVDAFLEAEERAVCSVRYRSGGKCRVPGGSGPPLERIGTCGISPRTPGGADPADPEFIYPGNRNGAGSDFGRCDGCPGAAL